MVPAKRLRERSWEKVHTGAVVCWPPPHRVGQGKPGDCRKPGGYRFLQIRAVHIYSPSKQVGSAAVPGVRLALAGKAGRADWGQTRE